MKKLIERYKKLNPDFDVGKCPTKKDVRDVLRVNTLKISDKELIERLTKIGIKLTKINFLKHAYKYKAEFSLASTTEYCLGYFYLQEAASQIPAIILNPSETDIVLDMCAAPGSKTTYLSQIMKNKGILVAIDDSSSRLKSLRSNLGRCGCKNTISYKKDSRFIFDLGKKFNKILLDAPCSGNCVIEPDFFKIKDVQGFKDRAKLQKELLKAAYKVLEKNGDLVYSTCSLEPEENELVINWFLKKYPDMKIQDIPLKVPGANSGLTKIFDQEINPEVSKAMRVWPTSGMQGFFICLLKKNIQIKKEF